MTVQEIITQASNLLSGKIGEQELYTWFNEIEMMIQMQLFGLARADAVQYQVGKGEVQPIAEGHYERVYSYWLLAKGHLRLKNESGYHRYRKLYVSEYEAYRKWVIRTHGTKDAAGKDRGVYLSAYGIACKHGFVGSEQQWLASLQGRDGADGLQGPKGEAGKDGAAYDLQYDQSTHKLQLLRDGQSMRTFDLTQQMSVVSMQADQLSYTFASEDEGEVAFSWSSTAGGKGSVSCTVNGKVVSTAAAEQGEVTLALGQYLQVGVNQVVLQVRDAYGSVGVLELSVTAVALGIFSDFSADLPFSGDITYRYTPSGACLKTVYFELDGVLHGTAQTAYSGRQLSYVIPALSHGHHTLKVYARATVGESEMQTDALYYDLICTEQGNTTPIIASDFCTARVLQYTRLAIPYVVYVPGQTLAELVISEDGQEAAVLQVTSERQTYEYVCAAMGEHEIRLRCGQTERVLRFTVADAGIDVQIERSDLALWLDAAGRSNSEQQPDRWSFTDGAGNETKASFSGFGWKTDGWVQDDTGGRVLRIPAGGSVHVPYPLFAGDARTDGLTVEVVLATRDVVDFESVVLDCYTNRGLEIRARAAQLDSEQSSSLCSFAEEQTVHLCFVIEPQNAQRLVHTFVNGVDSGVLQYAPDDSFTQAQPEGLTLGSEGCMVDVHAIRVYRAALSRHAVLDHFVASAQDPVEMAARYRRNLVYDEYGRIVPGSVPAQLSYLIVESETLPQYKGDKRTCSGSYVDRENNAASFTFSDAVIDVQGTSSQYYATKNFKIAFKGGFVGADGIMRTEYALREGQIPTHTFCFKADVASSEGANNVKLVDLYCGACPFETEAQKADSRVRQGIDGKPILLFWRNATTGEVSFWGKYNFNHDKSTPEVFGFDRKKYPRQQSWEFLNNTSDRVLFASADFSDEGWKNDFEARFPEDFADPTDLARVIGFVASCNPDTATGESLPDSTVIDGVNYASDTAEYRLAKFRSEAGQYFDLTDLLWYYLYTELFLMIDSRAKNMFLTSDDGQIWYFLPYDFDTALGINNEGQLRFSYDLEDVDRVRDGDVYNGQQSVLWRCVRQCFADELADMYAAMRTVGDRTYLGKQKVIEAFARHQQTWGEAVFNEDCQKKYLEPLYRDHDASYLPMIQGSKSAQRLYWVKGRFAYLDAKYCAGDVLADHAVFRGYAKHDLTLTPNTGTYLNVKYGSYREQVRAERGVAYVLPCPLDNVNDTEIILYGASSLLDIGDLSGFYPGYANLSAATRLSELHIGCGEEGYLNTNLTSLAVGNNRMLRIIDVQNCPSLSEPLGLSGCPGIREVYAKGSGITAVDLPVGGTLRVLQLPGTLHSLTVRDHPYLHDFSLQGSEQLTTLRIENTPIDSAALIAASPMLERVRLVGVEWELEDTAVLDRLLDGSIAGIAAGGTFVNAPVVVGVAYLADELTDAQLAAYAAAFPELSLIVSLGLMDCTGAYIKDCTGTYIIPLE